nr:hypothetical protein [Alphaproteobacteria bacterium]
RFEGLSPNLYWEQDLSLFSVKNSAGEAVADTASDRISLGHLQAETTATGAVQYRVGEDAPDYATPFADLGTTVRVDKAGYYTIDVGGGTGDYALSVHEDVDYSYTPAEKSSQEGKGANIDPEDLDLIDFHISIPLLASPSGSTNFFNSDTGSTWFYEGKENEPTTYRAPYDGEIPTFNGINTGPVLYPVTSGSYGDDFDNLDGNLRFRLEVFEHDGYSIDSLALLFSPQINAPGFGQWVPPDWSKQFFSSLSLEDAKHGDGSVVWEFDFDVKSALSAVSAVSESDLPHYLIRHITGFDFSFSRVSDDIDLAYSFEFLGVTDAQDDPAPSGIFSDFDHFTSHFY